MKLINKTISYYFLICIPLMLLAAVNSYYVVKSEIQEVSDEALGQDIMHAQRLVHTFDAPKSMKLGFDELSSIVISVPHKDGFFYSDTSIYNNYEKEFEVYRMVKHYFNNNNQTYLITILKPTIEQEELIEGLFFSFSIILIFLIFAFFIVNWLLSKTLWNPFYKTLGQLNQYDIKNHTVAHFETSTTKEFKQLNDSLNQMTDKIYADYTQQKEFTENASHEMQTPLAVIKANINLLMQSPHLREVEMSQIQAIDNTIKKLSALNKALLLLSKIENHQFKEESEIAVIDTTKKVLSNFQDLINSKNISLEMEFKNDIKIKANQGLMDILLTNLIQNSIRHNQSNGLIKISTDVNSLIISNTGDPLTINEDELFMRFKKNVASKESLGLGLSIVKGICDNYNFKISYNYKANFHVFEIKFSLDLL